MQQSRPSLTQAASKELSQLQAIQRRMFWMIIIPILLLTALACAFAKPASRPVTRITMRTHLPTLTPTSLATPALLEAATAPAEAGEVVAATPVSPQAEVPAEDSPLAPTPSPTETTTPPPLPTSTPTATATPTSTTTPLPEGWTFANVRVSNDPEKGDLLFYGELINNTGASQKLVKINASFYDAQGQPLHVRRVADFWPVEIIPQSGGVPFGLTAEGLQSMADFELKVEAQPSNATPQVEFEFSNLHASDQAGDYCLTGQVRNPGGIFSSYFTIVAILYDQQDQVINFGDDYNLSANDLAGGQIKRFVICVNPFEQEVARHELKAWGL